MTMLTSQIMSATVQRPLHVLSDAELRFLKVSSISNWHDDTWEFDNPTLGKARNDSLIRWKVPLNDGAFLTDPKHRDLLDWLRRVVWSLLTVPGDNHPPIKPGSMIAITSGLRKVVPWFVENSIRWPSELTTSVLDSFIEDLPERVARHFGDEEDVDHGKALRGSAWNAISWIYYIWRQRRALEDAGIRPMPSKPWPHLRGANSLAVQISRSARGWIQPLPDEVAIPLFNKAMWFLDTPAKDVLAMMGVAYAAFEGQGECRKTNNEEAKKKAKSMRVREALSLFEFSAVPGENAPWHASLADATRGMSAATQVRSVQLLLSVQAACVVVLQGYTGLRVSELCGLRAGIDPESGLPNIVEKRLSHSGLNEEFILTGYLSKGQTYPQKVLWLLGSRRVGDTELPPGVTAILILDRLLARFREMLGSDGLLVTVNAKYGLPKNQSQVRATTRVDILLWQKNFTREWVDLSQLPDQSRHATEPNDLIRWRESRGAILTTHQLRKTYAHYVLSVHPSLLPAVKRQFQHLNMSITESGYWGSNAPQIEPIHSVSRQMTARMLFEATQGRSRLSGQMGDLITANLDELRQLVAGIDTTSAWIKLNRWVGMSGIHVSHGTHGACIPVVASRMQCWKRSGSRPVGSLEPNYATREASLCVACSCFVMDERHIPFWKERFIEYEISRRTLKKHRIRDSRIREIIRRSEQARKKLVGLGISIPELESVVNERMNKHG